jgi:hypothetical protein
MTTVRCIQLEDKVRLSEPFSHFVHIPVFVIDAIGKNGEVR